MKTPFAYCFLLVLLLPTQSLLAQSLGLNWLFKPGMRFTTSFIPKQNVQDTINFGMMHFNTSLIIPVKGKAELNLGELNLRGSQTFLTVNAGTRFLQTELLGFQKLTHNFSFGITHLEANMKNGVWFYTVNMGVVESPETFDKISPFFIGAAAKIVMRDFYNHNIYGVGITYNYDRLIPFPLFGINRQLSDNWKLSMMLPAYAELIYSKKEDFQFAIRTDFSTFRTGIIPANERRLSPAQLREKASLQYRDVRLAASVRYAPSNRIRFLGQVGVAAFRSLRTFQGAEIIQSLVPPIAPFINLAVHINFGNAPLGSQIFGNEF
jgi:hypothetical protein